MKDDTEFPKPEAYRFKRTKLVPNSHMPLLVYRTPLKEAGDLEKKFKSVFAHHGWTKAWTDSIYDFEHFHTTAHEVLGIAKGHARVRFGGADGEVIELNQGDVIAIPAGVAHQRLHAGHGLTVVGAYAEGHDFDMNRPGEAADEGIEARRSERVPLPHQDPVYGEMGPLRMLWNKSPAR